MKAIPKRVMVFVSVLLVGVIASSGCAELKKTGEWMKKHPVETAAIAVAVAVVSWKVAGYVAEKREADAREEEAKRLQVAQAQSFYAEQCTSGAPIAATVGRTGGKASEEQRAEAAFAAGDYGVAAKLLQELYDARKGRARDPELDRLATKLAVAQLSAGEYDKAKAIAGEALESRERRLQASRQREKGIASLDLAESQTAVAHIERAIGEFGQAKGHYSDALQIRSREFGDAHLCVAQSQTNLGELYYLLGAYTRAKTLYLEALRTREKLLPDDHRDRAQSYNDLGSFYRAIALFDPAESYYERALANRRKLGEDHAEVADSYHNFASLYRAMGDLPRAESFYDKALQIRKARYKDGLPVAETETSLAELYLSWGDTARAEELLSHALEIRKGHLPKNHPDIAESLAGLARVRQARGDYRGAERSAQNAIEVWEKAFGKDNLAVAVGLTDLANLHLENGRLDDAEREARSALEMRRKATPEGQPPLPSAAESYQQLGTVYYSRGDHPRAQECFRSAIEIRRTRLGPGHPEIAVSLSYLAASLVATNRLDEALAAFQEAQGISEEMLRAMGLVATEARLEALLRTVRAQEEVVYSLLAERDLASRAAPLAASLALLRKGRSVDHAASISRAAYQGLSREDQALFAELRTVRGELARRKLSPVASDASPGDEALPQEKALADRAEQLERDLAKRSSAVRIRKTLPTLGTVLDQIAKRLPPKTVLVEVVRYQKYNFRPKGNEARWGEQRYAAMVLDGSGNVRAAELGPASPIDEKVKHFLELMDADPAQRAGSGDVLAIARELETRVIQPIQEPVTGAEAKAMVLSLDGQLNLLPFGALFDGKEYLVDRYLLSYVTSGRDLLAPSSKVRRSDEVVLLANPAFVEGASGASGRGHRGLILVPASEGRATESLVQLSPGALKLESPPDPLPGTAAEARAVHELIPRARVFLGSESTKRRFLGLHAPRILHVATHGLFRTDSASGAANARAVHGRLLSPMAEGSRRSEPLLDSMLLWTSASKVVATKEGHFAILEPEGVATALEVASMNLWGTQLVVLSACQTGLGQIDDLGQGVYGLRRAVIVAGAETLVTTLWSIDDAVTRDLMTSFYRRLLAGTGRGNALRQASLEVRKKHPDPHYWAPFIVVGQVGPIDDVGGPPQ